MFHKNILFYNIVIYRKLSVIRYNTSTDLFIQTPVYVQYVRLNCYRSVLMIAISRSLTTAILLNNFRLSRLQGRVILTYTMPKMAPSMPIPSIICRHSIKMPSGQCSVGYRDPYPIVVCGKNHLHILLTLHTLILL